MDRSLFLFLYLGWYVFNDAGNNANDDAIRLKRKYDKSGKVVLDFSQGNENAKMIVSLKSGVEAITPQITYKREKINPAHKQREKVNSSMNRVRRHIHDDDDDDDDNDGEWIFSIFSIKGRQISKHLIISRFTFTDIYLF